MFYLFLIEMQLLYWFQVYNINDGWLVIGFTTQWFNYTLKLYSYTRVVFFKY